MPLTIKLNPDTGAYAVSVELPVSLYVDNLDDTFAGLGTVQIPADQLVALRNELDQVIRHQGRRSQTWHNQRTGQTCTLHLQLDGSWSVWASESAPNFGPLRTKADYRQQVQAMRRLGMRPLSPTPISRVQEVA